MQTSDWGRPGQWVVQGGRAGEGVGGWCRGVRLGKKGVSLEGEAC